MTSTVYIAKNVYGGDGLGRLGDGRVVFVPGAWAGEQVKAEIVEEKKHFVKARLVEVVEASPDRLSPDRSSSEVEVDNGRLDVVPGMVYAGLKYEAELKAKEGQLRDFFDRARISCPEFTSTTLHSSLLPLNYRNKVVYHFAKQKGSWVIGYRKEPSHELVDIVSDPLARPEINAAIPEVRKAVLSLLANGPIAVRKATAEKENVTIRWSKRTGVKWWIGKAPDNVVIKEETCGKVFEVPAGGFYQMNPEVGEALVRAVVDEVKREGEGGQRNILDLYCGVGVFGLCAASELLNRTTTQPLNVSLIGIESGRQAIEFAKRNAANQKFANAKFFAEEVGRNRKRIPIGANTTVIVDPPRDGLEPGVAEWLAASKAPRIIYVSCDPATLMRDLRVITRNYDVSKVQWFNMFPRTARFETMVVLEKKAR